MTTSLAAPTRHEGASTTDLWWRNAVIYQVYVRSFADGNGDGVGDLVGLESKMDYLTDLGVDALWLTPIYRSPMKDFGYDVSDYRAIDPVFGDVEAVERLIGKVHAHDLKFIMDIVPNHTSDAHAWFQQAVAAQPGSPERDRYIFRAGTGPDGEFPPNDWESIFGGPAWTRLADGQWYLHLFDKSQPDLNWTNEEVLAEFDEVLRFWLDRGVDGFRIDVAHGMVKAEGLPDVGFTNQVQMLGTTVLPYFDQDGVHEIHRRWRKIFNSYQPQRIGVAEAWAPSAQRLANYLRPDELHQAFNFHYLETKWSAQAFRAVIDSSIEEAALVGAPSTWVLSNHDVQRHVTRYGDGPIGLDRARAAALLTLSLPGSAYVYQGEELGLGQVLDIPAELQYDPQRLRDPESGRDGCRVPLPWSEGANFGFSTGNPWLPQPASWSSLTVDAQLMDAESTLNLYREALRLRAKLVAIGGEGIQWVDLGDKDLLSFTRGEQFQAILNFADFPVTIAVPGKPVLTSNPSVHIFGDRVTLPANSGTWWEL